MNSTPNAAPGTDARTGSAPYISACPRGSSISRRRCTSSRLAACMHLDGAIGLSGHCGPRFVDSVPGLAIERLLRRGGVPERLKGTDCKSVGARLRWFESNPLHQAEI